VIYQAPPASKREGLFFASLALFLRSSCALLVLFLCSSCALLADRNFFPLLSQQKHFSWLNFFVFFGYYYSMNEGTHTSSSDQWFIKVDETLHGPFQSNEIIAKILNPDADLAKTISFSIKLETPIFNASTEEWKTAADLIPLFDLQKSTQKTFLLTKNIYELFTKT
jgi:hypothetical protein